MSSDALDVMGAVVVVVVDIDAREPREALRDMVMVTEGG